MGNVAIKSAAFAFIAMLSTGGCNWDVVTTRYETLAKFEDRGWLPKEILPPSTRAILTENNLDFNVSYGHFEFEPKDVAVFLAKVKPGPPPRPSYSVWSDVVADYRDDGLSVWQYSEDRSHWALFCDLDAARCQYSMWLDR
jgi:hypothetical protein